MQKAKSLSKLSSLHISVKTLVQKPSVLDIVGAEAQREPALHLSMDWDCCFVLMAALNNTLDSNASTPHYMSKIPGG